MPASCAVYTLIDTNSQEHGTSQNLNDAWKALPPDQREKYQAMSKPYLDELAAEIAAFNARIPLSPSIPSEPGSDDSEDGDVLDERRGAQRWNRYRRDHPRACGGAVAPTPDKPFKFFSLPLKLRKKVYELVLDKSLLLRHEEADQSADGVKGPIDVRIFAVSRIMREETMSYFFENNVFAIAVGDDNIAGALPLFVRKYTPRPISWPVEKIKRVEISVTIQKSLQVPFLRPLLKRVCDMLAGCTQLAGIRITPTCPTRCYNVRLDSDMDCLLESFLCVKGVEDVTWTIDEGELWTRYKMGDNRAVGTEEQRVRIGQIMMDRA